MPTILDVAAKAGVSTATVSRVLSGSPSPVRPATRERVLEAARQLAYKPNPVARGLCGKSTNTVGVIVSDIGNPFYADVIKGIEDAGLPEGYSLFVGNTNFDLVRGESVLRSMVDHRVDGLILLFSRATDPLLALLDEHNICVSIVDRDPALTHQGAIAISVDYEPGIRAAVHRLLELGHRDFAHVTGPRNLHTTHLRREAFLQALAERGIERSRVQIVEGDYRTGGGEAAARRLFSRHLSPTAIFAANDLMAIGLAAEIKRRGMRIPEDVSILGLDGIDQASCFQPSLATVAMPRYEIGHLAMSSLVRRMRKDPRERSQALELEVRTQFVPGASIGTRRELLDASGFQAGR
jgi:LacI family transcriptional regulator